MKPTLAQRIFADQLPERIAAVAGPLAFMTWAATAYIPVLELRPASVAAFVFYEVVAGLLGFILAGFGFALLFGPLYTARGERNGAPYRCGDWVMILSGKHRGRVARVYQTWESRQQVRVELSDEERDKIEDVFNYVAVLRHPAVPEQPPSLVP